MLRTPIFYLDKTKRIKKAKVTTAVVEGIFITNIIRNTYSKFGKMHLFH